MKIKKKNNQSGFSLVELSIVSVILVFVIGILATVVSNVQTSYATMRPRTEALNDATAALDMITRLIRMAGNNPKNIAGLQGINPGTATGGQYRTIQIRSDWRSAAAGSASTSDADTLDPYENVRFSVVNNTLMKQETPADTAAVAFLNNVGDITFTYFDTNNVLIANPVTGVGNISRVDVTLVMRVAGSPDMTFTSSAFLRRF